jgi:type I restriction enzyme R subunit
VHIDIDIDIDVEGYRPEKGTVDRDGNEVEDRICNQKDFDRTIVIDPTGQAGKSDHRGREQGSKAPPS